MFLTINCFHITQQTCLEWSLLLALLVHISCKLQKQYLNGFTSPNWKHLLQLMLISKQQALINTMQKQEESLKLTKKIHTFKLYTVEPQLSGLVGTTRNSLDNRGSG